MGNREDLLTGARKAIVERGLAKVTARDIAGAAGVSLAAIGYHFGSKEQLIAEAITEGMGTQIGDDFEAVIRSAGQGRTLRESLGPTWDGLRGVLERNHDALMLMFENGLRTIRSPEAQGYMAQATEGAYADLGRTLREVHPELSEAEARAVAKFYFCLLQGLAILWMLAPDSDPVDGDCVVTALGALDRK